MDNSKQEEEHLQKEYFDTTVKIFDFNKLSDSQIDILVDKLLGCIPENKHLYKYRSFNSDKFHETLENIGNGQIFLPKANLLNDKIDCTFNYQTLRSDEEILEYVKAHVYQFYLVNLKSTKNKALLQNKEIKFDVLTKLSQGVTHQLIASSIKFNCSYKQKLKYVRDVVNEAQTYVLSKGYLTDLMTKYKNLGEYIRNRTHVFSMCESCMQDSMWAYYANDNNGYCIEYDLTKIKNLDGTIKRKLLNFYKVEYSNYQQPVDAIDLYEVTILSQKKALDKMQSINKQIIKSFVTKSISWEHEKEWRLILEGNQDLINADLVCGVIIDEDHLHSDKAQELIKVAREKELLIKMRCLDRKTNTFKIIPYNG